MLDSKVKEYKGKLSVISGQLSVINSGCNTIKIYLRHKENSSILLRNVQIFMGLEGDFPLWMLFDVIDN